MQTFLPYSDFTETANVLDMRRLGKQRVEALQLLKGQWPNHPASKMWKNHRESLALYGVTICQRWIDLGYKDTCTEKILALVDEDIDFNEIDYPHWLGDEEFHISHQSNLLRKDFAYYSQFFQNVPDNMPYIWPE
jgi:hypothetical protein